MFCFSVGLPACLPPLPSRNSAQKDPRGAGTAEMFSRQRLNFPYDPSPAQHSTAVRSFQREPCLLPALINHSQSRAWKRQGHRAAGAQSTLSRRSQRRRGARGGDDSAVARESQQTAAALHAALCSGAATGAGPCPSVTPPCQHSFAPGPSRFRAVPRDPPALWLADTCSTSVSESLLSLSAGAALTGTLGRELAAGTAAFRCPALLTGWGGAVFGA